LQDVQCISGLGIAVFYVTDVFAVPKCQVSTGLAYVRPVACFTCQSVYADFVVVLRCVVGFRFGQLLQCVCTLKTIFIWYNKTCRQKQLTLTYVNIRINGKNQQCQKTLRTANQYRLNQEINFLYTKKLKLDEQLFKLHLKCTEKWQSIWPIIIQSIDYKLTMEMETHYNNLNRKLDKLQREKQTRRKTDTHHQRTQFYTRTVNLTNIRFSREELAFLNNGLQYSIEKPLKKYWTDLLMETEQAIRMLDSKMQAPFGSWQPRN